MGVALTYSVSGPIPQEAKASILAELPSVVASHEWWSESMNLFDVPGYSLFGSTKLFIPGGYTDQEGQVKEVSPEKDAFMAERDAQKIIETLSDWSERFQLTWTLEAGGGHVGRITNGQPDSGVQEFGKQLALMAQMLDMMGDDGEIAGMISDEFFDR